MGLPVVTVASGGLPIVETTAGTPVTEATNGRGVAVTKVVGKPGMAVTFETIGAGGGGTTYATWDAVTVTAVTLSGGNLVATNTGTTSADQGARVAAAAGKTSGKYYYEVTATTVIPSSGNQSVAVGTTTSTYTGMGGSATTGVSAYRAGSVYANGSGTATVTGGFITGTIFGVAVDLDNRRVWFRASPSGNWNGNASNNPVTNVGGVTIPAGTMVPFLTFGGSGGTASNVMTTNFGATAFLGAVPSGFTAGWPV